MVFWAWLAVVHAAEPTEISAAIQEFNTGAIFALPVLSEAQLDALATGDVLTMLTRGHSAEVWRALGFVVAEAPQHAIWLSCQDPHFSNVERVTELRLAGDASIDRATWYGFLDLPMPVADRHWVVDVWNNHALAQQTDGRMWEHPWRLNENGREMVRPHVVAGAVDGLTEAVFDGAIFTPINDGAWVAMRLSSTETLLIYHGSTDIGGVLPGKLVAQFNASGMKALLEGVVARATQEVPGHYRAGHESVLGGDGQPIPLYP